MQQVSFRRMDEGTPADYALLNSLEDEFVAALPERILAALGELEQSLAGYQISRLEHSLQSATRAERDGADIEMIVGALIHDLGDDLAPLTIPTCGGDYPPLCAKRSRLDHRASRCFSEVLLW